MKIKWYGHSAFCLLADSGLRLIIDPYDPRAYPEELTYKAIEDSADIVLTSHSHNDHGYAKGIHGDFLHVYRSGNYVYRGTNISAIDTYHDDSQGTKRGSNLLFVVSFDGIRIAHLGDLGHLLPPDIIYEIGRVDVLLVPVGGYFTIDFSQASQIMKDLNPIITIPMHYKTNKCSFPIAPVDPFLFGKPSVRHLRSSELVLYPSTLPTEPAIYVLDYAL